MIFRYTFKDGNKTLVDLADAHFLAGNNMSWWIVDRGTGLKHVARQQGRKTVYLHRLILNAKPGDMVDHIDGDGLNNRRQNLRLVSSRGNSYSFRRKAKNKTSKFRGVSWCKVTKLWRATIYWEGKQLQLGRFSSERKAALQRDRYAKKFHGTFASFNFSNH